MTIGEYEFVVRLTLAMTLLWAGSRKLFGVRTFAAAVAAYRLVPHRLAYPTAMAVIAFELVIGTALAVGAQRPAAAAASAILFLVFALAVIASLVRGLNIECHCYGSDEDPITFGTAARSLLLLSLSTGLLTVDLATESTIATKAIIPALTIAVGIATLLYHAPLLRTAWLGLRQPVGSFGSPTYRVTYRDLPITAALQPRGVLPRAGHEASGLDPTREGTGAA
jgi:putative oxidoreductase